MMPNSKFLAKILVTLIALFKSLQGRISEGALMED